MALVTELQRHDNEMKLLDRLNDLLQTCTTQEEAYQVIALMAGELFAGQSGCLAILHARDQYLETAARWGEEAPVESIFSLEDCWAMRRGNSPLCVAMLDLDHFKRFNDTFGHDAGDSLLRELGQVLREKLRKIDIVCRYGGEEFVLVLPDSSTNLLARRSWAFRKMMVSK